MATQILHVDLAPDDTGFACEELHGDVQFGVPGVRIYFNKHSAEHCRIVEELATAMGGEVRWFAAAGPDAESVKREVQG